MLFVLGVVGVLATGNLQRGIEALHQQKLAEAERLLAACTVEDARNAECWWELGWARYVQRDWPGALAAWKQVQGLDPSHAALDTQLAAVEALIAGNSEAARAKAAAPEHLEPRAGEQLRIRAVGDLMIGSSFPAGELPPEDGVGSFAHVRDLLRDADATFGNLEGPLCDGGQTLKCAPGAAGGSCYAFRSPTRYARFYKDAGFDALSTANNHAGDFGPECRVATLSALAAQGIRASGPVGTVAEWEVRGRRVGFLAFATYPATWDLTDEAGATAAISALASRTDVTVVSFHGGAEGSQAIRVPHGPETFFGENRGDLRRFTHLAVDAGADVVVGSGPHVLRGMEVYRDRLIAYSLGNFATYGHFNRSGNQGLGAILDASLDGEGRFLGGRILGTRQTGRGIPVPDPANAAADLVRVLTAQDFPQWGVRVAKDGTLAAR